MTTSNHPLLTRSYPSGIPSPDTIESRAITFETAARDILEAARADGRPLTADEKVDVDALTETAHGARARGAELRDNATRMANMEALSRDLPTSSTFGGARVTSEPRTYDQRSSSDGISYFGDLVKRQVFNDGGAHERLASHRSEVMRETRDISRVDTAGGEFVPPMWLTAQFAEFARAPRVVGRLMTNIPLPLGTDQINIPRITTGAQVAVQTADNASVQETDLVTATVTAPVRTIPGQQDVALQLLEQLMADYERALDVQLMSGSGASGQLQGLLGLTGITSTVYTDGTPTVPEFYTPLHQAVAGVLNARQLPPEAAVTNSRWWAWAAAQLDSSNRPLVVPSGAGPTNAFGSTQAPQNGQLGALGVVPFFGTTSVATNLGVGTNETRTIVGRFSDSYLYESEGRTRVLPDVGSGTLTVRLQFYKYAAVAHRFPGSYAVISGTGLIMPAGY